MSARPSRPLPGIGVQVANESTWPVAALSTMGRIRRFSRVFKAATFLNDQPETWQPWVVRKSRLPRWPSCGYRGVLAVWEEDSSPSWGTSWMRLIASIDRIDKHPLSSRCGSPVVGERKREDPFDFAQGKHAPSQLPTQVAERVQVLPYRSTMAASCCRSPSRATDHPPISIAAPHSRKPTSHQTH